jgi:hypothetical protein
MFAGTKRPRQESIIETEVNVMNRIQKLVGTLEALPSRLKPLGSMAALLLLFLIKSSQADVVSIQAGLI